MTEQQWVMVVIAQIYAKVKTHVPTHIHTQTHTHTQTFDMIIFFNEILSQRRKKIPLLIHQEFSFRSNRGLVY